MSKEKPNFLALYLILTPVILVPAAVILFLLVRGGESEQLYNKALAAAAKGNYKLAAVEFEAAGKHGHAESYYSLARLYQSGMIPADNPREMIYVNLIRAYLHGSIPAAYELGKLSLLPPEADFGQAALYFHTAALGGHARAQLELGKLYEHGKGIKKSTLLAREFYHKAAVQGCAEAQTALGILLITGTDGKPDHIQAEKFLLQAAEQRYAQAFTALGFIREQAAAANPDNPVFDTQAGEFYKLAAELNDPEGLVNYGDWLMKHNNSAAALNNYRQAVDKHNFAPAMHRLGVYYFKQQDHKQAKKYFEQAAALGYAPSRKNLQIMADKLAAPARP